MEQFDTDEKLVQSSQDKKKESSGFHCLIILIFCVIALGLIFFLFKYLRKPNSEDDLSAVNHSKLFLY